MSAADDYRKAQLALAARTTSRLADVWVLFDPEDAATIARWLDAAGMIVAEAHGQSAALARAYYRTARAAALGIAAGSIGTLPTPGLVAEAVRASMTATGPASYYSAIGRGRDPAGSYIAAQVNAARAGSRAASMGGRDTITAAVAQDPKAVGWVRVTGGNPCPFCVMQAQRGAVYSAGTVDFSSHANCACQPAPEFTR